MTVTGNVAAAAADAAAAAAAASVALCFRVSAVRGKETRLSFLMTSNMMPASFDQLKDSFYSS